MIARQWLAAALVAVPAGLGAQTRSMAQDSTLDNLSFPAGVVTAATGSLGRVHKVGQGPRMMVLIPGIGFSGGVWEEFMARHRTDYTMYAVTLPGFGDTAPLPLPPPGTSFAETPWINSAVQAILALLDRERIPRATLVGHWALASQIALQLALEHPDRVEAVVLVGGVLKAYYDATPAMATWTPDQRVRFSDGMAMRWFRTVTRQTWDDNNFMSYDYAINPRRGLFLWREAQAPMLPVWIRYLLEFYAVDLSGRLPDLRVPTLVVQPLFNDPGFHVEPNGNYMRSLVLESWRGSEQASSRLRFVTVSQSRLFVMFDRPDELDAALATFFQAVTR